MSSVAHDDRPYPSTGEAIVIVLLYSAMMALLISTLVIGFMSHGPTTAATSSPSERHVYSSSAGPTTDVPMRSPSGPYVYSYSTRPTAGPSDRRGDPLISAMQDCLRQLRLYHGPVDGEGGLHTTKALGDYRRSRRFNRETSPEA